MQGLRAAGLLYLATLSVLSACGDEPTGAPPPVVTVPVGPTATDARPTTSTTVDIRWADNSSNEDGFRIERTDLAGNFWAVDSTGPNVTSFADSGLQPWSRRCYRVIAFNGVGESEASNTDCTWLYPPPENVAAAKVAPLVVQLLWLGRTPSSTPPTGYDIQRSVAESGPFVPVAIVPSHDGGCCYDPFYTHYDTVPTAASYWYRIRTVTEDSGFSDFATVGATDAAAPPEAPSGTAAVGQNTSMTVSWVDNSVNEEGFRVERSIDEGASWVTVGRTNLNVYELGERASYEQTVCYRVFAFNGTGDSAPSNTSCTAVPAPPSNLSATAVDSETVELTWTDNSSVEDGYAVWAVVGYGCCFEYLAWAPANATSVRVRVIADVGYTFAVRAVKGRSYSDAGAGQYP